METLHVTERTGNFNFADPAEQSVSVHIVYRNGENMRSINLNFREEKGVEGYTEVEDVEWLIDAWVKSIWISTSKEDVLDFKKVILSRAEEIARGNRKAKLAKLYDLLHKTQTQIDSLEHEISIAK